MAKHNRVDIVPNEGIAGRKTPRLDTCFDMTYKTRSKSGSGKIRDISSSGALIKQADTPLDTGSEITVEFSIFEDSIPLSIPAYIVREVPEGFAVRFREMDPRTRTVLKVSIAKAIHLMNENPEDVVQRVGDKLR